MARGKGAQESQPVEDTLREHVDSSGYPLQLRLEQEVFRTRDNHKWRVSAVEHHWAHPVSALEGYADLILANDHTLHTLVVECKRKTHEPMIFLLPTTKKSLTDDAFAYIRIPRHTGGTICAWALVPTPPTCDAAAFCVLPPKGGRDRPTLEGLADTLLLSVEAIADEEKRLGDATDTRIYTPVYVTTSPLYTCVVDPETISIETGKLSSAQFAPVEWVRFTKALGPSLGKSRKARTIGLATARKTRTIFVVRAPALERFLCQLVLPHDTREILKVIRYGEDPVDW